MSNPKQFHDDIVDFIHDQIKINPDNIDDIIDKVSESDPKINSIMKTILAIEKIKLIQNNSST